MNNLEEQKLTVLEVQISDELNAEELDIVSGGCGQGHGSDNDGVDDSVFALINIGTVNFGTSGGLFSNLSKGKKSSKPSK